MARKSETAAVELGKRIKEAAKLLGALGPVEVGKKLGVNKQTASKWLKGQTKIMSADDLFMIAGKLNVSPRWLFTGKEPRYEATPATENEQRVLQLYRDLPEEWRDDWVSNGVKIQQNLKVKATVGNPFGRGE